MFNSLTNSAVISPTQSFIRNSQGVTPLLGPNQWNRTSLNATSIASGNSFLNSRSTRSSAGSASIGGLFNSGVSPISRSNPMSRGQSRLMTLGRKKVSPSNDPLASGSQNQIGVDLQNVSTRPVGYSNPRRYRSSNRSSGSRSSRGSRGSGRALSREFSTINDTFSL